VIDIDRLAVRLAEELAPRLASELAPLLERDGLVDAEELARLLGVSRAYVYLHAQRLGVIRLGEQGDGRRPRLRFDVDSAMQAEAEYERKSDQPRRRGASRRVGETRTTLLPIRGEGA
jgi:hypothetical protein